MSYARSILRGISVVLGFTVLANVLGYFLRIYLGRTLPLDDFGLVYSLFSLFGFLALLIFLGFGEATTKFIADYRAKRDPRRAALSASSVFWAQMAASTVIGLAVLLLADRIALSYFHSPESALLVQVYAIALWLSPFEALFLHVFQAYQRPMYYSVLQVSRAAFLLCATYALFRLFPDAGVINAIIPYAAIYLPMIVACVPLLRRAIPGANPLRGFDRRLFWKILLYGLPIMLTTISWAILTQTDTVVITAFRPLEEVGLYNAALPIANILLFLPTSIVTVFFPVVAELWSARKRRLLADAVARAYVLIGAAVIPPVVLFTAFPDILLNLLFGGSFVFARTTLVLLSVSTVFATFAMFNGALLAGIGKPKLMTVSVVIGAIVNLVGDLFLIPRIGYVGAGYATIAAQGFIFLCSVSFVHRDLRFRVPWRRLTMAILAGAGLAGTVHALRLLVPWSLWPKLAMVLLIAGAVYVGLLLALGVLTRSELRDIARQVGLTAGPEKI